LVVRGKHRGATLANRQRRRQVFLDRHLTAELDIARAVGDAEAALAQHRYDLVAADQLARLERYVVDIRNLAGRRRTGRRRSWGLKRGGRTWPFAS